VSKIKVADTKLGIITDTDIESDELESDCRIGGRL
jgi:hypothetical protein